MMRQTGFVDSEAGPGIDTFGGAGGEANARTFEVFGYPFVARKPE
jgi:arsenite methyltransferase